MKFKKNDTVYSPLFKYLTGTVTEVNSKIVIAVCNESGEECTFFPDGRYLEHSNICLFKNPISLPEENDFVWVFDEITAEWQIKKVFKYLDRNVQCFKHQGFQKTGEFSENEHTTIFKIFKPIEENPFL